MRDGGDPGQKTLLTLFLKEARVALGRIPDDYHDKLPLNFSSAPRGSFQLLECYLTEFLLVLLRGGDESGSSILRSENSRALGQSSLIELIIAYRAELEKLVTAYIAEKLETVQMGFSVIDQGIAEDDIDKFLQGNRYIQEAFGKQEVQFGTQAEFDEFMDSDEALKL